VNAYHLYARARLGGVGNKERISWVLSYVQGGVAEVWKDNILDETEKGTLEVETMEELFEKIREEFRRAARGSGYEGRALIDEFKRGLNGTIRRKLAKAESSPSTIME